MTHFLLLSIFFFFFSTSKIQDGPDRLRFPRRVQGRRSPTFTGFTYLMFLPPIVTRMNINSWEGDTYRGNFLCLGPMGQYWPLYGRQKYLSIYQMFDTIFPSCRHAPQHQESPILHVISLGFLIYLQAFNKLGLSIPPMDLTHVKHNCRLVIRCTWFARALIVPFSNSISVGNFCDYNNLLGH